MHRAQRILDEMAHFGTTSDGRVVLARVKDHAPGAQPGASRYKRFNHRIALWITRNVGTMSCFWVFNVLALMSLPATLKLAGVISDDAVFPAFIMTVGFIALISWMAQSYAQLILLPALMVGQNLQDEAADVRAAKTFEDVERVLDLLRMDTLGGLRDLYDAITTENGRNIDGLHDKLTGEIEIIKAKLGIEQPDPEPPR